jgi:hypothetical protein
MHIDIGDLVKCRGGTKVGLVVDKKPSNEGLDLSMHVRHLIDRYPNVYYVYFSEEGKTGPFHKADLTLQQSCHSMDPL